MIDTTMTQDTLESLTTEGRNEHSMNIDMKSSIDILRIINAEDKTVPFAVEKAIDHIAGLVDDIVAAFRKGGRLVYIGAGTSGRLGILDASECPPTFGVPPAMVQGLIAGGSDALVRSIEGAEDDLEGGSRATSTGSWASGPTTSSSGSPRRGRRPTSSAPWPGPVNSGPSSPP